MSDVILMRSRPTWARAFPPVVVPASCAVPWRGHAPRNDRHDHGRAHDGARLHTGGALALETGGQPVQAALLHRAAPP
eukprot:6188310-Pleurochrysis_carterae.AAC.1